MRPLRWAWALLLCGCPGPDNPYLPFPEADFDDYITSVQPVVDEGCAFLGCHGDHTRELTLYSVAYLRAPPANFGTALTPDLTDGELVWNYDAFRARLIDEEVADEARLLLKCLDPDKGGIVHAGGAVVFETTEDPGYVAIRDWIEGAL